MDKKQWSKQTGQALLIVVLVMVIALTVGLSVASRSITNLRTSSEEASSQKALSAAEAGIEQSAKSGTAIGNGSFSTDTTYKTSITSMDGTSILLNGGNIITQDDGIDLWLVPHQADGTPNYSSRYNGNLSIYWGDTTKSDCQNAALEVAVIYNTTANPLLTKYAFDPCAARRSQNNFSATSNGGTIRGVTFRYSASIPGVSNGMVVKIIPLYASSSMGIVGSVALPSQGSVITSTGTSGTTQRKVTVFQGYPELPSEYFPYSIFSP